jgi:tRNA threonylcarbamoyl adenosine modification protein YeaZ
MIVLAIDTSSAAVVTGLVELKPDGAQVLARRGTVNARGHTELLAPAIAACLAEAGATPPDLAAIVAGLGPGAFTGLRVGLVTAAAMAHALDIPAYGVCSLDAFAAAHADVGELLVVTDARRHEVFWARYSGGRRIEGPSVGRPADVPVGDAEAVVGTGTVLFDWPVPALDAPYPAPEPLTRCAVERILRGEPAEQLVPLYLRRPDAVPGTPKPVRR